MFLLLDAGSRAGLGEPAGADLGRGPVAVGDDRVGDVLLRHGHGVVDRARDVQRAVVHRSRLDAQVVALEQVDGGGGGVLGLRLDGLVDRHELLVGEDALDGRQLRVLPGGRDVGRVEAGGLHGGDGPARGAVVRGVDARDVVLAEGGDGLVHLVLGLGGRPVRRVVLLADL
jgi:hypothetical protein